MISLLVNGIKYSKFCSENRNERKKEPERRRRGDNITKDNKEVGVTTWTALVWLRAKYTGEL
jgi:hypothetical protein